MAAWFKEATRLAELGVGSVSAAPGHIIPNYAKVLRVGMKGMVEEYERIKATKTSEKHREFIDALILSLKTARDLGLRYAMKAEELAAQEADLKRRAELEEIARICRKVPWEPAETFWEALQSLWMTHMLVMAAESYPGPGLSYGRWDQYVYPYY